MRHTLIALSAISALIGISQAHASEYKSLPVNKDARLTIGASATYNADAYRTDNSLIVLPQAFYDNNRLYIEGAELGAYPYKDDKHHIRVGLSYDGRSFDPSDADSSELKLLDKRDASALAHVSYMRVTPVGGFRAKLTTDLLGKHDGQTLSLAHISRFSHGDLTVYPSVGVTWQSKDYNQYYYGVSAAESARSGVAAYEAKSSWSPFISATAQYQATDHVSVFANQRLEWLSSTQKDSPMTDGSLSSTTRLGVNYRF